MSISEDRRQPHPKPLPLRETLHRRPDDHLERIRRFDDAFAKGFGWVAIAVFILIAVVAVVAS